MADVKGKSIRVNELGMRAVLDAPTSYSAFIEDSERRLRRGERQKWCGMCGKWRWDDEPCCNYPRWTERRFNAEAKRIEREVRAAYPTAEDRYLGELRAHLKDETQL